MCIKKWEFGGWECSLVVEHWFSVYKALDSIPSTTQGEGMEFELKERKNTKKTAGLPSLQIPSTSRM